MLESKGTLQIIGLLLSFFKKNQSETQEKITAYGLESYPWAELFSVYVISATAFGETIAKQRKGISVLFRHFYHSFLHSINI